ncbi:MAG: hypothetical protein GY791_16915 [Alphaproteobacteria bacterium]|nr:hypothetical protein [Alphaproteobacteria bacterium]
MYRKTYFTNNHSWNWAEAVPFATAVEVGDQVFISGQQTLDESGSVIDKGDIAGQARNVFENMKRTLALSGLTLNDLVRLNTYYVFEGDDADATRYWEDMTRVRLEYFPDPGPAATAVRVKGMPYDGQLIQIEGVAVKGNSRKQRRRIMPEGSWDWSIAVPLSQGWRVGDRIFVGGQISADGEGRPVAAGDIDAQTRNIYTFIERVVRDAGGDLDDIVHVKICFKHDGTDSMSRDYLANILAITSDTFEELGPVVTAFGVDLLYPGLVLEIDAMAIVDPERSRLTPAGLGGRYQPELSSDGWRASDEIYVGGQVPLGADGSLLAPGDVEEQARIVFERVRRVLAEGGAELDDLVKLNLFLVAEQGDSDVAGKFHKVARVWSEVAPNAHPAMTPVRVYGLPGAGTLVQADAIAVK